MEELNKEQYMEIVKLIEKMLPQSELTYGIVEGFDDKNRLVKLKLEPSGAETGWCRVLQGAFCDKTGMEALVASVRGVDAEEYIVLGIIE